MFIKLKVMIAPMHEKSRESQTRTVIETLIKIQNLDQRKRETRAKHGATANVFDLSRVKKRDSKKRGVARKEDSESIPPKFRSNPTLRSNTFR